MGFQETLAAGLAELRRSGLYRELRSPFGLSFVDNDYLGLSQHPKIIEAGQWALRAAGAGSRGSRLLGGHSDHFDELEQKLARFFGAPAALFFSSGYLANLGIIQALSESADCIVSDEKNHASLIDGIRLSGRPKQIVAHNAWDTVEPKGRALLVAESLYSMDGDFADFDGIQRLLERSPESFLILDEAHAAGVFAEDGRGMSAGWRDWERMAVVVTFGKAFGAAGAAVFCSTTVREWLVNRARTFIYTTAPPPVLAAMVASACDVLLEEGPWRRREIWERAQTVRGILSQVDPNLRAKNGDWASRSPIIPLLIPGPDRALRFCENMRESGVELRAIRYPTVPKGTERLRISLNLSVSRENTEGMAEEVVRKCREFL